MIQKLLFTLFAKQSDSYIMSVTYRLSLQERKTAVEEGIVVAEAVLVPLP